MYGRPVDENEAGREEATSGNDDIGDVYDVWDMTQPLCLSHRL